MHNFTLTIDDENTTVSGIHNGQIHFLFGRNGTGKSRLLQALDQYLQEKDDFACIYISPERGGQLTFWHQAGNFTERPQELKTASRVNEKNDFRQIAYFHFDELKNVIRKKYEESNGKASKFSKTLERINSVLENIKIKERDKSGFDVLLKMSDVGDIKQSISSGEKELIGLLIEIALFFETVVPEQHNVIILDEPDVHLHPDAQRYVFQFVRSYIDDLSSNGDSTVAVLVATHSTDLLSGLNADQFRVAYLQHYIPESICFDVTPAKSGFLLSFGSHPLVMSIDSRPVMIVEGEDDKRIWDDVIRRLVGRLNLWVVASGSKEKAIKDSKLLNQLLGALSESARGFLLVDRDDDEYGSIPDIERVTQTYTQCNEIENLLLSNEVLQTRSGVRIENTLAELQIDHDDRTEINIKGREQEVSNLLGWPHNWESLVSKVIAENVDRSTALLSEEYSIFSFLGQKFTNAIFQPQLEQLDVDTEIA